MKSERSPADEPTIARASTRMIAIVYDGMLILALLFLVGVVLTFIGTTMTMEVGTRSDEARELPVWYQNLVMTPAFILTLIGFYGLFWRRAGQTLGMQTWRLKTVTAKGELLTWKQSVQRILSACVVPMLCALVAGLLHGFSSTSRVAILSSAFFGLIFNYAFCMFNRRGLAVQDMLSNTVTLKMPKIQHESLWQSFKNRKYDKNKTKS